MATTVLTFTFLSSEEPSPEFLASLPTETRAAVVRHVHTQEARMEKLNSGFGGPRFGIATQDLGTSNTFAKLAKAEEPKDSASLFKSAFGSTHKPATPTSTVQVKQKVKDEQKDKDLSVLSYMAGEKTDNPFTFTAISAKLESQWRDVQWTEGQKTSLMNTVSSYTPSCEEVTRARVLLLGPVGSGKSSFISSVQSVFSGRVTNRATVGSSSTSFTKKLQSFNICGQKGEDPTRLVLCDTMGLGDGEMTGLTLHDILSVIKGHVPEGHKFRPDQPVTSETSGYVKWPSRNDKIHCVAFVVDASKIGTYPKGLSSALQQLREHISDLGVHQVALLTHVDTICPETAKDVTQVYKSARIQVTMGKAAALLGMSTSYIVPVKNYSSELDVDVNTDVLLLSAVDHILQYADLYFQDSTPKDTESKLQ
ncbi:interferon-induced protein 44-like [Scophthalmus maximus]|uniref:interferon-induced protein 44-like n=1 Tax=Scophthalmus maximus TaxID=52904 RepID=UPI000F358554|nr:interferon-induced protein 44-like [Scophthalmus maximus]